MLKTGEIIRLETTIIGTTKEKNNQRRFSVVLFATDDYVCACPIASRVAMVSKCPERYFYVPYLLADTKKNTVVKVGDVHLYPVDSATSTRLFMSEDGNLDRLLECAFKFVSKDPNNKEHVIAKDELSKVIEDRKQIKSQKVKKIGSKR